MKLVAYENSNSLAYVFSPLVLEPHKVRYTCIKLTGVAVRTETLRLSEKYPYEEDEATLTPVTIHATTRQQIKFRLNTGRLNYV